MPTLHNKSRGPRKRTKTEFNWGVPDGTVTDHQSKREAPVKDMARRLRIQFRGMEEGICSRCRNTLFRDHDGRAFHPIGAIPKGEECTVGVPVKPIQEEGYSAWAWHASGIGYIKATHSELELNVPHYVFFSLKDLND